MHIVYIILIEEKNTKNVNNYYTIAKSKMTTIQKGQPSKGGILTTMNWDGPPRFLVTCHVSYMMILKNEMNCWILKHKHFLPCWPKTLLLISCPQISTQPYENSIINSCKSLPQIQSLIRSQIWILKSNLKILNLAWICS